MITLGSMKEFVGYFSSLVGWTLKQGFTKEKMAQKIAVDLSAHNSAVCINCADNPDIRVWMRVSNYTPFNQKIDKITATFYQGGVSLKMREDRKHTIPPFSEEKIFLQENISSDQAKQIALADDKSNRPRFDYHFEITNRLYDIQKSGSLESPPIEKLNAHIHSADK